MDKSDLDCRLSAEARTRGLEFTTVASVDLRPRADFSGECLTLSDLGSSDSLHALLSESDIGEFLVSAVAILDTGEESLGSGDELSDSRYPESGELHTSAAVRFVH